MKIAFDTTMVDEFDQPIPVPAADQLKYGGRKEMQLLDIARTALTMGLPDDQATPEAKFERWDLWKKIKAKKWDLSAEEVVLLKKSIGRAYTAGLVAGQARDIIEPRPEAVQGAKAS